MRNGVMKPHHRDTENAKRSPLSLSRFGEPSDLRIKIVNGGISEPF
jgi:hypothetical protein